MRNKILHGNSFEKIKNVPDNYVDTIITSPPYWGLRDYRTKLIWLGGGKDCPHNDLVNTIKGGRIKRNKDRYPKQTKLTYNQFSAYPYEVHNDKSNWSKEGQKRSNKNGKYVTTYIRKKRDGGIGEKRQIKESENFQNIKKKQFAFCNLCGAWYGQLGLEPDFRMYIDHLMLLMKECFRILKPEGSLWVNLGDTYYTKSGSGFLNDKLNKKVTNLKRGINVANEIRGLGLLKSKTLVGIPDRFKIAMIDAGWICRNDVIWHKPNCMPSSIKDRFTVDHERFFFFTKKRKYYFELQLEEVGPLNRWGGKIAQRRLKDQKWGGKTNAPKRGRTYGNSRIKRTVWRIHTIGYSEGHFAVFPKSLIETPIKACCPEKICVKCGKAWRKIYKDTFSKEKLPKTVHKREKGDDIKFGSKSFMNIKGGGKTLTKLREEHPIKTILEKCDCNAKTVAGIVFDPFFGRGTVGKVAYDLRRDFLGIDLNPEYIKLAKKYINRIKRLDEFL